MRVCGAWIRIFSHFRIHIAHLAACSGPPPPTTTTNNNNNNNHHHHHHQQQQQQQPTPHPTRNGSRRASRGARISETLLLVKRPSVANQTKQKQLY